MRTILYSALVAASLSAAPSYAADTPLAGSEHATIVLEFTSCGRPVLIESITDSGVAWFMPGNEGWPELVPLVRDMLDAGTATAIELNPRCVRA